MGICVIPFLVVVHQINIEYITVFEPKYDAPVTADADAPVPFPNRDGWHVQRLRVGLVAAFIRIYEIEASRAHRVHVVLGLAGPLGARRARQDMLFERG